MNFFRRFPSFAKAIVLPTVLALSVFACQGEHASGKNASAAPNLYEQLKQNKVVRVGTGFDVELAREVFKRIGIEKVEFVEGPWDSLIAGVDAGRYEAVANQVGITPARQAKYDFSQPYIASPLVVIAREDDQTIHRLEDIKGKKAAQTATSNFGQTAVKYGAQIVTSDGFAQSVDLLTTGRADVTLNDRLSFLDYKKQKPDAKIKVVATDAEPAHSGILLKKGSPELVAAINKALDEIKADGTYSKISTRFFGVDVSKP